MTPPESAGRMIVALGPAGVHGQTLWARTGPHRPDAALVFWQQPARQHARDETVQTAHRKLPQARETFGVLGLKDVDRWGLEHGINEHQLVAGALPLHGRFPLERPGLQTDELIRLTLERCRNVTQAVDFLTAMIQEHGQGPFAGGPADAPDGGFLLADPGEAVVLETAGRYWALQAVREVRAMTGPATIRQDWDRVSGGLAATAIAQGWWPDDGRKVDFAGVAAPGDARDKNALRDWGQTTLRLEQRNGQITDRFVRELLAGGRGTGRRPGRMIAQLSSDPGRLPIAWFWLGGLSDLGDLGLSDLDDDEIHARHGVYLPLFVDGDLPDKLRRVEDLVGLQRRIEVGPRGNTDWLEERLADLQARLDQDAEAFAVEGAALRNTGEEEDDRRRLATFFMEHAVERLLDWLPAPARLSKRISSPAATPASEWSWL